jgi:hypothetical protein
MILFALLVIVAASALLAAILVGVLKLARWAWERRPQP